MSGPKVSDYELERQRQEQLRQQYLAEQRRIEAHRRQQEEFRSRILQNVSKIKSLKTEVTGLVNEISRNKNCQFNVRSFKNLCEKADDLIKRNMILHDSREIAAKAAEDCQKEAEQMIALLIQQNQKALDERMTLDSADFMGSFQSIRSMAGKSSQKVSQNQNNQDAQYEHRAKELYHAGCSILANAMADMPAKAERIRRLQKRLDSEMKELGGTAKETFQAVADCQAEITHQIKVWQKAEAQKREAQVRHSDLVRRYHYYCDELALDRMSVEELEAQSESMLESLCATLDNMLYRQYEENYIFECINEAMAELGYTLYGRAANGIRGQFLYRMHGDTLVHVSCSDQGIIAMEIGRAASGQRELDATEVEEQVHDMETFCGDYAALQQSLAEKGVKCRSNILLSPPHPDYAMVLDTSEYELTKAVETGMEQKVYRYIDGKG